MTILNQGNPLMTMKVWYKRDDEYDATLEGQTGHAPWTKAVIDDARNDLVNKGEIGGWLMITDATNKVIHEVPL